MESLVIDEEIRRKSNLRVLQRIDLSIIDIMGSATHVVLYEFNELSQEWEKRNVEGSLFLVKHLNSPNYKLVIMNRNSNENMYVPITINFQIQIREPYIIFKGYKDDVTINAPQKIRGIWFHDCDERKLISNLLEIVIMNLLRHNNLIYHSLNEKRSSLNKVCKLGKLDCVDSTSKLFFPIDLMKIDNMSANSRFSRIVSMQGSEYISGRYCSDDQILSVLYNKKTLRLSLMSLLRDDSFLDIIHSQYLKFTRIRH